MSAADRKAWADFINARIAELRDKLELSTIGKKQTQATRGAIAELRALLGLLFPKSSATSTNADATRKGIYS